MTDTHPQETVLVISRETIESALDALALKLVAMHGQIEAVRSQKEELAELLVFMQAKGIDGIPVIDLKKEKAPAAKPTPAPPPEKPKESTQRTCSVCGKAHPDVKFGGPRSTKCNACKLLPEKSEEEVKGTPGGEREKPRASSEPETRLCSRCSAMRLWQEFPGPGENACFPCQEELKAARKATETAAA